MVNTVGSYENKSWQKKWTPIKRSLALTQVQRSLIAGSLLGDGTMRIGRDAINANFKVEHGLAQKEYVIWKYEILKPFVFTGPKISYRCRIDREKYPKSWWFRTIRHPQLTEIYRIFYKGEGYRTGTKIVPLDIENLLDPLALAVWIMDDGSYQKGRIDISTYAFSIIEINLLIKSITERFVVNMNYYRDRDKGYRMYCNQKETKKLVEIVQPFMVSSMTYKIGLRSPVTTNPKGETLLKEAG